MQFIKFEDQWYDVKDIKRIEITNYGTKFRVYMKDGAEFDKILEQWQKSKRKK